MCKASVTSKAFMVFISLLFLACAAGLLFIGSWVFVQYHHYEHLAESLYTLVPAAILLGAGAFFIILGICGCVGACKEQKCLLGMFFTLLLIIFVGMVCAAALGWAYRYEVDSSINDGLMKGLQRYDMANETHWGEEVDFMQQNMKCCGVDNYTDWQTTPWAVRTQLLYPESCCEGKNCTYNVTPDPKLYSKGCYSLMKDEFMLHLGVIAGVAAAFAIVLILGMVFSCVLICKRRSEVPYIGLNEPNGMRV